jgi:hypothetical protein
LPWRRLAVPQSPLTFGRNQPFADRAMAPDEQERQPLSASSIFARDACSW